MKLSQDSCTQQLLNAAIISPKLRGAPAATPAAFWVAISTRKEENQGPSQGLEVKGHLRKPSGPLARAARHQPSAALTAAPGERPQPRTRSKSRRDRARADPTSPSLRPRSIATTPASGTGPGQRGGGRGSGLPDIEIEGEVALHAAGLEPRWPGPGKL